MPYPGILEAGRQVCYNRPMIDATTLLLFMSASILLIFAPGPDIIFLTAQGLRHGRRAGVTTAIGLAAGNLVHTLGAVIGVSVLFQASALAFTGLKIMGAGWLIWLAVKTLRETPADGDTGDTEPRGSLLLRGLLMNILNPKVALFFLAFLPQFAAPERGAVQAQMLFFGLLFTVMVAIIFGLIGFSAGFFNRWIGRGRNRFAAWLKRGAALVYLMLALRLLFTTR
jgi:threonine/homoserine/homoserine lactone efflux protein